MDHTAINYNEDCFYYDQNGNMINQCLFNDDSCVYSYDRCCSDDQAINYDELCEFHDDSICLYGFSLDASSSIEEFDKLYQIYMISESINFLNVFFIPNESTNTSWDYLKKSNRYNLFFNNDYLFSKNYFINPKSFLDNKPIFTEFKVGQDKNSFLIREKYNINKDFIKIKNMTLPVIITLSDYFQVMLYKNKIMQFREYIIEKFNDYEKITAGPGSGIVLYQSDFFSIELKGSISINGSLNYVKQDDSLSDQGQDDFNLNINQTQQFALSAYIGDKLTITADQNSASDFDWENTLKITYKGYENEIVQEVAIGNINLSLAHGTLASVSMGSSGLFGAKLVTKFGPLNISTVLGREKAIKNSKTYTGGQSDEGYTLQDYNFVKDKYFFIDTRFKGQFYPLTDGNTYSHEYSSSYVIKDFILYKKKQQGSAAEAGLQTGIAYVDLDFMLEEEDLIDGQNTEFGEWYQLIENVDYKLSREL